jgi:hypothetical protein
MHENYAKLVEQPQNSPRPALNKSFNCCSLFTYLYTPGFAFLIRIQRYYSCCHWVTTDIVMPQILKINPALNRSFIYHSLFTYLYTPRFTFLMWIQWFYSHRNWVKSNAAIPWILTINQIHQILPHLEYFPKRKCHSICPAAIHPTSPPNGCGKGRIIYYWYTTRDPK